MADEAPGTPGTPEYDAPPSEDDPVVPTEEPAPGS
jgi:hypothetical protein